jgi:hypothetical protein
MHPCFHGFGVPHNACALALSVQLFSDADAVPILTGDCLCWVHQPCGCQVLHRQGCWCWAHITWSLGPANSLLMINMTVWCFKLGLPCFDFDTETSGQVCISTALSCITALPSLSTANQRQPPYTSHGGTRPPARTINRLLAASRVVLHTECLSHTPASSASRLRLLLQQPAAFRVLLPH